jgi:hypothetical protein
VWLRVLILAVMFCWGVTALCAMLYVRARLLGVGECDGGVWEWLCRSFAWWGAGGPSLGLTFCIIDLVGFCAFALVMCGGEGWYSLQVWVSSPSTAMLVIGNAIGACGSWELL